MKRIIFITLLLSFILNGNIYAQQKENDPTKQQAQPNRQWPGNQRNGSGRGRTGQWTGGDSSENGERTSTPSPSRTSTQSSPQKSPENPTGEQPGTTVSTLIKSAPSSDNGANAEEESVISDQRGVLYSKIVRKNGWFEGVGKQLAEQDACQLNCYFKLSGKNKAGHWTLVEAINRSQEPTTEHSIPNLLVNQFDETDSYANDAWLEKLKTVCKWEFIADATGQEVIQEKSLNAQGNTICILTYTKMEKNTYLCSYTDAFGMPILLRTDHDGSSDECANYIIITRDERGFDVLYEFIDHEGYPQKNRDGAYMTSLEYDQQGRITKNLSLNTSGEKMTDDWGNCGWEERFYKKYTEFYYYDREWNHIKMPITNRNTSDHVYGYRSYQDKYGRDTLIMFIDANGKPDTNEFGVQKIRTKYHKSGICEYIGYYGSNNKLCAKNKFGYAQFRQTINNKGVVTKIEYLDVEGKYINGEEGLCLRKMSDNKHQIDYHMVGDSLFKMFEYSADKNGNKSYIWYSDSLQRLDSVDSKGREISCRYYNLNGEPVDFINSDDEWSAHTIKYDDNTKSYTEQWFDKDNESAFVSNGDFTYDKCFYESDKTHKISTYKYSIYDILNKAYQLHIDTFNNRQTWSQWDITPYGEKSRVGWFNTLHYTTIVEYTILNQLRSIKNYNEFNEPAYIVNIGTKGNGYVYCYSITNSKGATYYDENGKQIPDSTMSEFKASLPKAFCIEVTDTSIAYPLGLRNGDIIISYGDWTTTEEQIFNISYFYLETILKAKEKKQITVLRHFPKQKKSKIFHFELPEGRTSDLGFYPHMIYYTQKEKQRLLQTCVANNVTLPGLESIVLDTIERDFPVIMGVQLKGGFYETRLYHYPAYDIKDPGIVLYGKEKWNERIDTWSAIENTDVWEEIQGLFYIANSNLWFTQDLSTYRHVLKQNRGYFGMRFIELYVDSVTKNKIDSLVIDLSQQINDDILKDKVKRLYDPILKENLIGEWKAENSDEDGTYTQYIYLHDNNKAELQFDFNFTSEIARGVSADIVMSFKSKGLTWDVQDRTLLLDTTLMKNTVTIKNIEFMGNDKESVNEWIKNKKSYIQTYKEYIRKNLLTDIFETTEIKIESFTEEEMELKGIGTPLHKIKKRKK